MRIFKTTTIICLILTLASCNNKKQNPRLVEIVKAFNSQTPVYIDNSTVIDEIKLADDNTIEYYYSTTTKDTDTIKSKMFIKQALIDLISQNEQYKELKDLNASFKHIYKDSAGKTRFTVNVTPDDYNNNAEADKSVEALIKESVEMNKLQIPVAIDPSTTMVSNEFIAPDTLLQNYEVDRETLGGVEVSSSVLRGANIRYLVNTPNGLLVRLKSKNVIFKYVYTFSDGEVMTVVMSPKDYK